MFQYKRSCVYLKSRLRMNKDLFQRSPLNFLPAYILCKPAGDYTILTCPVHTFTHTTAAINVIVYRLNRRTINFNVCKRPAYRDINLFNTRSLLYCGISIAPNMCRTARHTALGVQRIRAADVGFLFLIKTTTTNWPWVRMRGKLHFGKYENVMRSTNGSMQAFSSQNSRCRRGLHAMFD